MKIANARHIMEDSVVEGVLVIESVEDILMYQEFLENGFKDALVMSLRKKRPSPDRWDHLYASRENMLAITAKAVAQIREENPVLLLGEMSSKMCNSMMKCSDSFPLIVNKRGGFCPAEGVWEILEAVEINSIPLERDNTKIVEGSKVINLENDPIIEDYSHKYMSEYYGEYSVITNLGRKMDENNLKGLLTSFKNKGGEVVFVYTTGLNSEQIEDYLDICLEVGIEEVNIHFNMGITERNDNILHKYKEKGLNVFWKDV